MTKIDIQYQDQFGRWRHLQTKHNEGDAYRSASNRARSTGTVSYTHLTLPTILLV